MNSIHDKIKSRGSVNCMFFALVSLYFNIHVIVINEKNNEEVKGTNMINKKISSPINKIILYLIPGHVYYKPLKHEKNIFKNIEKKIKGQVLCIEQLYEFDTDSESDSELWTREELEEYLSK